MFCKKCGAEIMDDAVICPKCGSHDGEYESLGKRRCIEFRLGDSRVFYSACRADIISCV